MDEVIFLKYDNPDKKFNKIIHLSDIHIRTGDPEKARYKDYLQVFNDLIEQFSNVDLTDALFVITGDTFHHKGKIEPCGIKLTNFLFKKLLELAPVIIICGNHDYRQDDPEIPDMIETLLDLYQKKYALYYLNKTGSYVFNNIGFGVVDIRDALKSYNTSGKKDLLIEFPKSELLKDVDYKIALFHGWVQDKPNDKDCFQCYPLSWIGDYPYVLLGDIHRHQVHFTEQTIYGYPGSLIQQDFGETVMEHGYITWHLSSKKVEFQKVYNPNGYCTLKKHNGDWYVHASKKEWYLLTDICKNEFFPKTPSIRMKHTENEDITNMLESINIKPSKIMKTVLDITETEDIVVREIVTTHLEELNTPQKWIDYLQYHTNTDYSYYILTPEHLKLPKTCESLKKYKERNDKIQKTLDEYNEKRTGLESNKGERVELVNMQWNYLMCYGENNHMDFTNLKNKIALLNGKNAMGKSSFLDILCIGLFGEPTKMRHMITGKKYTDKIIHDHRPSYKTAPSVYILLKIKGELFEIYRTFGTQVGLNKEHMISQKEANVSKLKDNYKQIICEGNTLVEKWIESHIGTMESVLMSTMICQMDLNNFFHLKQDDQKIILDTALHLENVSLYGKILKESLLAHQDLQTQIKTAMETVSLMMKQVNYNLTDVKNKYLLSKKTYEKQLKFKEDLLTKVPNSDWNQYSIPDDIVEKYRKIKDLYEYHYNDSEYKQLESKGDEMIRLEEKMLNYKSKMELYSDIEIEKDAEIKLQKWQTKKEKFMIKKPKCTITDEWVEQTENEYQKWVGKQKKEWIEDENKDEKTITLKLKIETLWNEAISKPLTQKTNNNADYKRIDIREFYVMKQQYDAMTKKQKPLPKEGYQEWEKRWKTWYAKNKVFMDWKDDIELNRKINTLEEKIRQVKEKEEELDDIRKEIKHLEKEMDFYKELSFNPKCNECKKNPFNKKKYDTESQYTELKPYSEKLIDYIDKFKKHSEKNQYEEKLIKYKQQYDDYNKYKVEKDYYELENKKWKTIIKEWEEYEKWKKEFTSLQYKYQYYEWFFYEKWENEYTIALEEKRKWDEFYKDYLSWENSMGQIEEQKKQLEMLKVWESEAVVVEDRINKYIKSIEKQDFECEFKELKSQYENSKKDVENWKKLKNIKENYETTSSYYAIYKLKEYEPVLLQSQENVEESYRNYLHFKKEEEEQKSYQETYDNYKTVENELNDRYQQIKDLDVYFMGDKSHTDGYKEWIYKQKVIPLLNQEMNNFLSLFEDFRFKMLYDKRQFIYLLEDRGNEPTLDKASGYQNFIISLAFRLALTRIGAIGQQFKHLFIDEGFTACDTNNIEKVPILLKSIMDYGEYHSIILMSHLDSVRECSEVSIQIKRTDPYSYIQYGDPYPKIEKTITPEGVVLEKKTRGRKPKNIN